MQMDYRYIFEYARRGVLLPLDDAMAAGDLDLSGFSEDAIAGGKVDGKIYGISLGANSSTMMVNKAAFEEAGVALPERGMTWDDYAARAAELTEKAGKRGFYGSSDGGGDEPTFECWLRQRGKALYDAEGKLGFDAGDATEWFAMWQAMRDSGACVPADLQALDQLTIETSMVTLGHAAVAFNHSNQIVGFQAVNQAPLVMVPYPTGGAGSKPGQYRKPSMFFSAYANTGVPVEAAKFVSYFINDPAATEVLGVERGVPESAAVREALSNTLDELGKAQIEFIENLGDLAGPLPPPPPAGAGEIAVRAEADQRGGRLRHAARGRAPRRWSPRPPRSWPGAEPMAAPHAATAPASAGAAGAARSGWLARAWAANGAGYMFLLPWLIGFLVLTARAVADLALPLLHQLRPAAAADLGRHRELRAHVHRRRQVHGVDAGDAVLRDLLGAAEARLRARGRGRAQPRHPAGCRSTARSSTCRR